MAKYAHIKEDIKEVVANIVYLYAGYGFTDYNQALREIEKSISNGDFDLEEDYGDLGDEASNAVEELVYNVAEPIAKKVCDKIEKAYQDTVDQVDAESSYLKTESTKNPNNPPLQVGLPSLFNGGK